MPNIKSSVRSVKTDAERRAANGPVKAEIRSTARKVEALLLQDQRRGPGHFESSGELIR